MDDLLGEFLVECGEGLATLDERIVAYEGNPSDAENLNVILRVFHSLKGACGIFSFSRMERLAHVSEDVLVAMRDGRLPVAQATVAPILSAVDRLKELIAAIEQLKSEPAGNGREDDSIIISLKDVLELAGGGSSHSSTPVRVPVESPVAPVQPKSKPSASEAPAPVAPVAQASTSNQLSLMDQSLRVGVDILDRLMNLVGELVLSRNQLLQLVASAETSPFISLVQQLNRVTSGLQEAVMRTRMQPIGNAWSKLPRIVRDLQGTVGKEIDLVMQGAETEIDRQILQAIQDPLTHCVRNAADHGLESPQDRQEMGKPTRGTITLRAFQEGGRIHIEVSDDGRGMDVEAVRRKGVEKGLISQEQATRLSDGDILNLVFEPGFSTAKKVTEISGRGVGLDVVRTNIEKVGGSVELKSELGVGTTIRIRIPLTLAIVPALIVGAKLGAVQETYAIPQLAVVELVRMTSEGRDRVEKLQGTQVLRLRDRLLPLVELSEILSGEKREVCDEGFVIVVQVGEARVGMRVDEIFDTQEIVVKPVGRLVREIPLYAGSTILGDGRVIMILEVSGVAMQSGALSSGKSASTEKSRQVELSSHASDDSEGRGAEMTRLLVFSSDVRESAKTAPLAVALGQVARLEEVDPEKIERVEDGFVLQYRGSLLPVMRPDGGPVSDLRFKPDGKIGVIVFNGKHEGAQVNVGLLVSEIIDIIDAPNLARKESSLRGKSGVAGSMIVQGRATEVIDVEYYLSRGRALGANFESERGVSSLQEVL